MAMWYKVYTTFSLYLAYKRISFYIKITTYHLSFEFESQNEDRWSNFANIFIFLLSNGVFPMLLTENTTNDTCQGNLRGAWKWRGKGTQRTKESPRVPPLYTLCLRLIWQCSTLCSPGNMGWDIIRVDHAGQHAWQQDGRQDINSDKSVMNN
jgi:hypothetical protein